MKNDQDKIDPATFRRLTTLIYDKIGIRLGSHKEAMVRARLSKRMRALGIKGFKKYCKYVDEDESGDELVELYNVISTNVTHFFREVRHFELLGPILRNWEEEGVARLRVWCAGCSTGEEAYSVAITISEAFKNTQDVKILATDISTKVLASARRGEYDRRILEKVPLGLLGKYFDKKMPVAGGSRPGKENRDVPSGRLPMYEVTEDLKAMIKFGRLNLSRTPYPLKGPLDLVFCRNVMIYFDNAVRKKLLDEIRRLLKPGGYLMVGHAESLTGMLSGFDRVEAAVYVNT